MPDAHLSYLLLLSVYDPSTTLPVVVGSVVKFPETLKLPYLLLLLVHLSHWTIVLLKFVAAIMFIFGHWNLSGHFWLILLRFSSLTVLSGLAWTNATVCCDIPLNAISISYNAYILAHVTCQSPHLSVASSLRNSLHWLPFRSVIYKTALITLKKLWKQDNWLSMWVASLSSTSLYSEILWSTTTTLSTGDKDQFPILAIQHHGILHGTLFLVVSYLWRLCWPWNSLL